MSGSSDPTLQAVSESVERLTNELRDNAMSLRMVPIGATFTFRVLDDQGAPVGSYGVGVETQVQYVDYSDGIANGEGQVFQQVQTDADGYATVTGVVPWNSEKSTRIVEFWCALSS